jgi:hypothetical protein
VVPRASSLVFLFSHPDWFSTVPRASGPIFMFCVPGLIFDGTEDVGSRLHVLRFRTSFRRNRGRRVLFSCFALSDSFWARARVEFLCFALPASFGAVLRASGPIFMFCARGLIWGGTYDVRFRFHILRSRTHFRRYRWHRVPFACFPFPDSFGALPRAPSPIFMFCTPILIFGGNEGARSRFHILRSRIRFPSYQGRRVPFHVLRSRTRFERYLGLESSFYVLRSLPRFEWYQGRRV